MKKKLELKNELFVDEENDQIRVRLICPYCENVHEQWVCENDRLELDSLKNSFECLRCKRKTSFVFELPKIVLEKPNKTLEKQ